MQQQQLAPQSHGLRWSAAGSLALAAQQGRMQPEAAPHGQPVPSTSQYHSSAAAGAQPTANQHNFSGGQSLQSHHQSNSYQPQMWHAQQPLAQPHPQSHMQFQSAQMSELQRQVEHYRQQLMFAQQELDEVKRAGATRGLTARTRMRDVDMVGDGGGGGERDASPSANPQRGVGRANAAAANNTTNNTNTPPSVSISTHNTTKRNTDASLVPRVLTLGSASAINTYMNVNDAHHGRQQQVPLMYRLDRLDKDIAAIKKYRIKRSELYSIVDEHHDVPGSVLVNLEAVLCPFVGVGGAGGFVLNDESADGGGLKKPRFNVKDISVMLVSVFAYVLGTDAELVLRKMGEEKGGKGTAHQVLSDYNTNATNNGGTMLGVFPTEVMCTTNAAAGAVECVTRGQSGRSAGGAGGLGGVPDSRSFKDTQRSVAAFVEFVGSLFVILNEFAADTGLLTSMVDELAQEMEGPSGSRGGREMHGGRCDKDGSPTMSWKTMAHNLVRTMQVLARVGVPGLATSTVSVVSGTLATSSSPSSPSSSSACSSAASMYAMDAVARFVHLLAKQRSAGSRAILTPVLKSKELQRVILAFPGASRDELLKYIMVMLEDKNTFLGMELDAAKELGVPPSRYAVCTANQLNNTPSMTGGITGIMRPRRHSMLNKRLSPGTDAAVEEDESAMPGDPLWASRLTQTINMCMRVPAAKQTNAISWKTVRLAMSFFAGLVEPGDALLQSVVDFKHLEKFSDGLDGRNDRYGETLMHHLVSISGAAAGSGSLLNPASCNDTDVAAQQAFLQNRRIVHESLVLLRALLTRIPGTVRTLALEDSNVSLCTLEKVSRFGMASVDEPALSDGRLALWVDALDAAHGRSNSSLESIAKVLKSMLLKELS